MLLLLVVVLALIMPLLAFAAYEQGLKDGKAEQQVTDRIIDLRAPTHVSLPPSYPSGQGAGVLHQ